jgi:hypothetical protein
MPIVAKWCSRSLRGSKVNMTWADAGRHWPRYGDGRIGRWNADKNSDAITVMRISL